MTDYRENYAILKQVCAEKSVIRNVSRHRKPDGTIDREGNLKLWNDAVARFQAAMGVQEVKGPDPIPFASEASAAWRSAQVNNQGILHRIRALTQLEKMHGPSAGDLVELHYEVMNLSFQQEVVTKVADKSSNAIQTLVKNQ